jgi:hypothetical protein
LFEHQHADEANDGAVIGKDADRFGSTPDFLVATFERIGAGDLGALQEPLEAEHVRGASRVTQGWRSRLIHGEIVSHGDPVNFGRRRHCTPTTGQSRSKVPSQ